MIDAPFSFADFTLEQVLAATVAEIQAEGPDFVYRRRSTPMSGSACLYAYEGRPDCLVGRVAHRLGASLETLERWASDAIGMLTASMSADRDVRDFLMILQGEQDNGSPWGEALHVALTDMRPDALAALNPDTLAAARALTAKWSTP